MSAWSTWDDEASQYVWAVICKNHKVHDRQNIYSGHKIPLGETDEFAPPPTLDFRITVKCDECGAEYEYDPKDLVRLQMELASDFKPHPLFMMT
jgi:hypothetical protein